MRVAGGTGGLGNAVSLAFLEEGAKVVVTYRKEEEFAALKKAAGAKAAALEGSLADVTEERATATLVASIVAQHSRLDALVNTVGGYAGGVVLWDLETKVFDMLLSLNLRSGYALARAALPAMLKQRHGSIVNVAAKAAVDHGAGVLPSIIDTAVNRKAMPNADFATWPKPEQLAQVILFLCSDNAAVIHGAAIPVYGNS